MEAWEEAELQILKAKNDAFIESQKGMLELTKMILRGTFLINGAAAAAVLAASWARSLYRYPFQKIVTDAGKNMVKYGDECAKNGNKIRLAVVGFVLLSVIMFVSGIGYAISVVLV